MSMILPDLPAPLAFGTVIGTFISIMADSNDIGDSPDAVALAGTVSISPIVKTFRITGTNPSTVVAQDVLAVIVNGQLLGPDGITPLRIMGSDSPNISPARVQYTAKFSLINVTTQPPAITFDVPSGGVIDISTVIPFPPAAPIVTVFSEATRIAAEAARDQAVAAALSAQTSSTAAAGAINDTTTATTTVWSSSKISALLATKQPVGDYATNAALASGVTAAEARANHTGTQAVATITGLATVATTGTYTDLSARPTLGTAAAQPTTAFDAAGTASAAVATQAASDAATYVTFKNQNGTAVTGKHVEITLTADGTDIDNIRVVTP